MKKITRILALLTVVSLFAVTKSSAQIDLGVSVQLTRPPQYENNERFHPNRPSPNHIWVAEEWVPTNGQYVYRPGYWALPPRAGAYWVPGNWRHRLYGRPGWRWHPGFWKYRY